MTVPEAPTNVFVRQAAPYLEVGWRDHPDNQTEDDAGDVTSITEDFIVEAGTLPDTFEDWGSVAEAADTTEDWGSVAAAADVTEDWGAVGTQRFVGAVTWPQTSILDVDVQPGQETYRVFARNIDGLSEPSALATGTTLAEPVATEAPELFDQPEGVLVTWEHENGLGVLDYVKVQRSDDDVDFTTLATLGGGERAFLDETAEPSTTYYYRTAVGNKLADDVASDSTEHTTLAAAPGPPTDVVVGRSGYTLVKIVFADSPDDPDRYELERSTDLDSWTEITGGELIPGMNVWNDTTGVGGTAYYYRIRAVKAGTAGSVWVGPFRVVFPKPPSLVDTHPRPPSPPFDLTATLSDTTATLSWLDCSGDERWWRVYRGPTPQNMTLRARFGAGTTQFTDPNLTPGLTYVYKVTAEGDYGESEPSNTVSVTVDPVDPPEPPGTLRVVSLGQREARLAWTATSADATHFRLELLAPDGRVHVRLFGSNEQEGTAGGLEPGTQYAARLRAEIEVGGQVLSWSSWSNVVVFTTQQVGRKPAVPTEAEFVASSENSLTAEWQSRDGLASVFDLRIRPRDARIETFRVRPANSSWIHTFQLPIDSDAV